MTSGTSKELGLSATTINSICSRYDYSRRTRKRPFLRYRGQKSLGWIPLKAVSFRLDKDRVTYLGESHQIVLSRQIPRGAIVKDGGSFSQDTFGRWYLNIVIEVPEQTPRDPISSVAIDLGLKDFVTLSTGKKNVAPKFYRRSERAIAVTQLARKTKGYRRVHAKIANRRKDFLHKLSSRITREFDLICIGDVSAKALARTNLAKSVHDVGWSTFRNMLAYKSVANGARYREVNEAFSTQTCSDCGVVSGPRGRKGLVIREWRCECGSVHDRDINAARNILRAGHCTPRGVIAG